jgi:D-alanine-D-alanine ligase
MKRFHRVAVLMGGISAEREVSLKSGERCAKALRERGYEVIEVDVTPQLAQDLSAIKPEACLNALHGRFGEDGCVQGLLEVMQIPYTHSGVLASALAMDKAQSRFIFEAAGIPIAKGGVIHPDRLREEMPFNVPFVLKPLNEGSSVGVQIVKDPTTFSFEDLCPSLKASSRILVEEFIAGRELTVSVKEGKALAVTEITSHHQFYDYEAKYQEGGSLHILPAQLSEDITEKVMDYATKAHKILGCRGVSRVDFRYNPDDSDRLVILEVNTQPGMTFTSLVPEQALYCGVSYSELVEWIMEDASCQR